MDQVMLEIISIVVSGIGLFSYITKYNIPETREPYYGGNLFLEKANIIDGVMNWVYAFVTVFGFFILIVKNIYQNNIPQSIYSYENYWIVFIISSFFSILIFNILSLIGKKIAKKKWEPIIINGFKEAMQIIEKEKLIDQNPQRAVEIINKIEKALDIEQIDQVVSIRFKKLKTFFTK